LKWDQCQSFQPNIKYLGYIIDEEGLRKDPSKLECVSKILQPTNVLELKYLFELINYYGKFEINFKIVEDMYHTKVHNA